MQFDYQTYAEAKMADYNRIAIAVYRLSQAQRATAKHEEPRISWSTHLMMSLGLRRPTIEYIGHAGV